MAESKSIWNEAGKAGLVLGLISIAYLCYNQFVAGIHTEAGIVAFTLSFLNVMLWAAKFAACIYLMRLFIKNHSGSFSYGVVVALYSAIIYSAFYLALYQLIIPGTLEAQMTDAVKTLPQIASFDSNSINEINNITQNIVRIGFYTNLIYCFVYGVILSAIFCKKQSGDNPFKNDKIDEQ